jgi:hypothetical protein
MASKSCSSHSREMISKYRLKSKNKLSKRILLLLWVRRSFLMKTSKNNNNNQLGMERCLDQLGFWTKFRLEQVMFRAMELHHKSSHHLLEESRSILLMKANQLQGFSDQLLWMRLKIKQCKQVVELTLDLWYSLLHNQHKRITTEVHKKSQWRLSTNLDPWDAKDARLTLTLHSNSLMREKRQIAIFVYSQMMCLLTTAVKLMSMDSGMIETSVLSFFMELTISSPLQLWRVGQQSSPHLFS